MNNVIFVSNDLSALLKQNRNFAPLAEHVQQLQQMQQHYARIAPAALRQNSQVFSIKQNIVTLIADNGAIAAKLRHSSSDLIDLFQKAGAEVTGIRVKVQVSNAPPSPAPPRPALSEVARKELTELADSLADSPLKNSLKRLATQKQRRQTS